MVATPDLGAAAPNAPPTALIDSSVVMAASLSTRGAAHDLFAAGRLGRIILVGSQHVLGETERNLYRKAPHGLRAFWELRSQLRLVEPSSALIDEVATYIEPKDAAIVAAALMAQADFLVTYDRRHLLSQADLIRSQFHIETVEPAVLLARLD